MPACVAVMGKEGVHADVGAALSMALNQLPCVACASWNGDGVQGRSGGIGGGRCVQLELEVALELGMGEGMGAHQLACPVHIDRGCHGC